MVNRTATGGGRAWAGCVVLAAAWPAGAAAEYFHQATLTGPGGNDGFGSRVAIAGDLALVGSPDATVNGFGSGAAYLYQRSGEDWLPLQTLLPDRPFDSFDFGSDVALHGTTALVGSSGDRSFDNTAGSSGAAYVFEPTGGAWQLSDKFIGGDANPGDSFGLRVDLHGDRAVVGAPRHDVNGFNVNGAAYVFDRQPDGTWNQLDKLVHPDGGNALAQFGLDVAIDSAGGVAVGAPGDDVLGPFGGAGFAFEPTSTGYDQGTRLPAISQGTFTFIGSSIARDGDRIVVGADGGFRGAALVLKNTPQDSQPSWEQVQAIFGCFGSDFGRDVALSDNRLIVGDPSARIDGKDDAGRASVSLWDDSAGRFTFDSNFSSPQPKANERFGQAVAIDGDYAIVGNLDGLSDDEPGAAYIYKRYDRGAIPDELQNTLAAVARQADSADGQAFTLAPPGQAVTVAAGPSGNTPTSASEGLIQIDLADLPGGPLRLTAAVLTLDATAVDLPGTGGEGQQQGRGVFTDIIGYAGDGTFAAEHANLQPSTNSADGVLSLGGFTIYEPETLTINLSVFSLQSLLDENPTHLGLGLEARNLSYPDDTISATYDADAFTLELEYHRYGDLNYDGLVNLADIAAFSLALREPGPYFAAYGNHGRVTGDLNGDGVVDLGDVLPFVGLLEGVSPADTAALLALVPEPTAALWLAVGGLGLAGRRGRGHR